MPVTRQWQFVTASFESIRAGCLSNDCWRNISITLSDHQVGDLSAIDSMTMSAPLPE
jgi:hypothetical protein